LLTLVVMLVAAINYQLNLGYALTFLLAGAGLVSMHLTHGNLRGLTLHLKPVASVFAGEPARLEVVLTNPARARHGLGLRPDAAAEATAWCDVDAGGQQTTQLTLVPPVRGWHDVPTLVVQTRFPFGLFRAWSVWRPAGRVLAWPRPESPAPALPAPSILFERADLVIVNEGEAAVYGGALDQARGLVAVTYGARGAALVEAAPPAVTPVDTTGAGDCFSAALTLALVEGRPKEQALRFACAAGAAATTRAGAQTGMPWRAEVEALSPPPV
jgi:hypothetical protein